MKEVPDTVGVICAGGSGSRLWPLTIALNKHLLPVYNKPMIHYPLSVLMLAGIRDIVVVSDEQSIAVFKLALGDGTQWGLSLHYRVQAKSDGILGCLLSAEDIIEGRSICVILGDNFFYGSYLSTFLNKSRALVQATIITTEVADPKPFAVVIRDRLGNVQSIVEKPENPVSSEVVTGLYFFPQDCLERARKIKPSDRGEHEITDLNLSYLEDDALGTERLPRGTIWLDCGTHSDLLRASSLVHDLEELQGIRISSLEEIAWRRGWLRDTDVIAQCEGIPDKVYVAYLSNLMYRLSD